MQELEAHYMDCSLATEARLSLSENELPPGTEPMLQHVRQGTLREIVQGEQRTPSSDEVVSWVRNCYRENPLVGDIARAMFVINEDLGILRTSYPPAANGRLGDAENPDFQPLIIGKPRHSLGFLPSRAHLSRSRQ